MRLTDIQEEFCIRYYHWSTDEFRREIRESFPYLRLFKTGPAWSLVEFMGGLSSQEQMILANGLLKSFHPKAAKLLEDGISVAEAGLTEQFRIARRRLSPLDEEMLAKELSGQKIRYASRRILRKQIIHRATTLLGGGPTIFSDSEIVFKKNCCGWVIATFFDFGGRSDQMRYYHSIISECGPGASSVPEVVLQRFISLHSWLGLNSQTSWKYLLDEDIQPACDCIINLCRLFLNAAPKLLENLVN